VMPKDPIWAPGGPDYKAGAAPAAPTAAATTAPTAVPAAKCDKLPNMPTAAAGALGSPDNPIVITFVPSGDVPTITKAGDDTAACLNKITGLSYKINVGTSYAASIEAMGANKAQFSFLATFAAILAKEKYGVTPALVAVRNYSTNEVDPDASLKGKPEPFYKAQFLTQASSGIKTLADLKGKTFCFVDPTSTSGSVVPQIIMKANGIDPNKDLKAVQNAGSHPNVVAAVYKGDCDAGVSYIDARLDSGIQKTYPDVMTKVVPFYDSDKIPNDGLQVAKGVDPSIKDATVNGLLSMMADPGGNAIVYKAYQYNALQKVDPTYYDAFEALLKKAGVDAATLVK
ncbi:MAG: phosphate/phosphite/phosphonate ABC transporter substrate-binding protein, partial [Chloroflexi bacterium]|nr:phosphate/phosphite/phosphonate ABC transporter substrate-binding protein [Chloroflexota bacterium]